jgi:glycerol-3-phosphate acyltransferase PlsY
LDHTELPSARTLVLTASPWTFALGVGVAYLLGGISPGHWLVRQRTGHDLRDHGSGATGATNAARILGRSGFVVVLALDAIKGALAVALALALGIGGGWEFGVATAVIAGHVWPLQLRFRGGRGLGPLLGAWLVLAPLALIGAMLVAAVVWAATRRRILGGMVGAAVLPATTFWETNAAAAAGFAAVTFVIVALAHRTRRQ